MLPNLLRGFLITITYFALCVAGALAFRKFAKPAREVFRKTLHFILLLSLIVWVYAFGDWKTSVTALILFVAALYPILTLAQRFKGYSELLIERKPGEVRMSFVIVFVMFAVIIAVCWGWLHDEILVFASVYAWGFGDAAAALVGKKYGRNFLTGKLIEGRKSVEGSVAMFAVSFLCVIVILLIRGNLTWYGYPVIALLTAAASAAVELYTRNGFDTVTCPLAACAVILPLVKVFGA